MEFVFQRKKTHFLSSFIDQLFLAEIGANLYLVGRKFERSLLKALYGYYHSYQTIWHLSLQEQQNNDRTGLKRIAQQSIFLALQ